MVFSKFKQKNTLTDGSVKAFQGLIRLKNSYFSLHIKKDWDIIALIQSEDELIGYMS